MSLVKEEYIPTIDAILRVSDLQKITVKKIRLALESLFGIQFSSDDGLKKEINEVILERFYKLEEERSNSGENDVSLPDQIKKLTQENRLLTNQLNLSLRKQDMKKARQKTKKQVNTSRTTPLATMKWRISKELGDVLGDDSDIPRPQIIKRLWAYIKGNDLQNPEDKRVVKCDEKLKRIFQVDEINQFRMNTALNQHIFRIPPEEQPQPDESEIVPTTVEDDLVPE